MQDPSDSASRHPDALNPGNSADEVPVFPVMKEKAPPVPPPVEQQPPPLPPPVDDPLSAASCVASDLQVCLPSRRTHRVGRRRRFPRRRMALVAAILTLVCFGLCSDDRIESQTPTLKATPVVLIDLASPAVTVSERTQIEEPIDYIVEEVATDTEHVPVRVNATEVVEVEPIISHNTTTSTSTGSTETVEVVRAQTARPNRSLPVTKTPVPTPKPADDAVKLVDAPEPEPGVCQLTFAPERMLGTSVVWAETANEAAMLADGQGKLVFLIQVSGNFEIPEFT